MESTIGSCQKKVKNLLEEIYDNNDDATKKKLLRL